MGVTEQMKDGGVCSYAGFSGTSMLFPQMRVYRFPLKAVGCGEDSCCLIVDVCERLQYWYLYLVIQCIRKTLFNLYLLLQLNCTIWYSVQVRSTCTLSLVNIDQYYNTPVQVHCTTADTVHCTQKFNTARRDDNRQWGVLYRSTTGE